MSGQNNFGERNGVRDALVSLRFFFHLVLIPFISNYFRYCDYSVCQRSECNEEEQNRGWGIGVSNSTGGGLVGAI